METEYDLAKLAEDLAGAFPSINELYLFGSRARNTKSTRSDADVLVVADEYIKPQQLREFSSKNCKALDLFIVEGSKATSSQNESFIEAENFQGLLALLGAVKIWSRAEGRAKANIEWRFKVREGVEFLATALPNISLKNEDQSSTPLDPSRLTISGLLGSLTVAQLRAVIAAIIGALAAAGGIGYWIGIKFPPPPT